MAAAPAGAIRHADFYSGLRVRRHLKVSGDERPVVRCLSQWVEWMGNVCRRVEQKDKHMNDTQRNSNRNSPRNSPSAPQVGNSGRTFNPRQSSEEESDSYGNLPQEYSVPIGRPVNDEVFRHWQEEAVHATITPSTDACEDESAG